MSHVITHKCTGCLKCVNVCPVACIVPDPEKPLCYIDPDTCIDCASCVPECPKSAIFSDQEVPADSQDDIKVNSDFFKSGPGYGSL